MYSLTFSGSYVLCRTMEPQKQQPLKDGESYRKAALICVSSPKRVHVKETVALSGPCLHSHTLPRTCPPPSCPFGGHQDCPLLGLRHPGLPSLSPSLQVPHSLLAPLSGHNHFLPLHLGHSRSLPDSTSPLGICSPHSSQRCLCEPRPCL